MLCMSSEHTLYPMRGTGVQEIIIEVSVTSVLKCGALPIGGSTNTERVYMYLECVHVCGYAIYKITPLLLSNSLELVNSHS